MALSLTDLLNAKSLNKYYTGVKGDTLVEAMFPATFSNTFDFSVLGSVNGGVVKVLQGSELDVDPFARDWELKTTTKGDKQFFRESLKLNERQRKELLEILNTNDTAIIENYSEQIYRQFAGKTGFLASARAVATYTASQFLSTAKVPFIDENGGGAKTIDYKLDNKYKETLAGTNAWNTATATPLEDLIRWKEIVEENGGTVEIALMNKATYTMLKNQTNVKAVYNKLTNVLITEDDKKRIIEEMTGLSIVIWNEKINVKGRVQSVFPNNIVTLIPNGQLGKMEYGPTPTKTDQMLGIAGDREIVDIAGTFATLEVEQEVKATAVRNVNVVVEAVVAPNPNIVNSMFIATVG